MDVECDWRGRWCSDPVAAMSVNSRDPGFDTELGHAGLDHVIYSNLKIEHLELELEHSTIELLIEELLVFVYFYSLNSKYNKQLKGAMTN